MILTGTRNNTLVTIEVNAVPCIFLEYILPSIPDVKAPIAETISERLKMKWFAVLFAAYAVHEMITMTIRFNFG